MEQSFYLLHEDEDEDEGMILQYIDMGEHEAYQMDKMEQMNHDLIRVEYEYDEHL